MRLRSLKIGLIVMHSIGFRLESSTLKGPRATDPSKPSLSFIRSVCYPDLHSLKSAACNMELTMKVLHERSTRKEFLRWMPNIQIVNIGVIIELLYPFMGATPHAIVNCRWCCHGVLPVANENSTFCMKMIKN